LILPHHRLSQPDVTNPLAEIETMNDSARINERILRKEHTRDYLAKIESSSKKVAATFLSAEIKRLSLRHFDSLQLNTHFISRIARTRLEHAIIEKIEDQLTKLLERTKAELDAEIDRAEILLKEHGITNVTTTYDVEPLSIVLKVISNWDGSTTRYCRKPIS
jgi:hypothetical protein